MGSPSRLDLAQRISLPLFCSGIQGLRYGCLSLASAAVKWQEGDSCCAYPEILLQPRSVEHGQREPVGLLGWRTAYDLWPESVFVAGSAREDDGGHENHVGEEKASR